MGYEDDINDDMENLSIRNGRAEHRESDDEDERYDEVEYRDVVNQKKMDDLSTRKDNGCLFCMQTVLFSVKNPNTGHQRIGDNRTHKTNDRITGYPRIGEEQMYKIKLRVDESKQQCLFRINGSASIADWINEDIISVYNRSLDPRMTPFEKITATQLYNHFCKHIESIENDIDESIEQTKTITRGIFDQGGILKQSKTKVSARTGKNKIKIDTDMLSAFEKMTKLKNTLIRTKMDLRMGSKRK